MPRKGPRGLTGVIPVVPTLSWEPRVRGHSLEEEETKKRGIHEVLMAGHSVASRVVPRPICSATALQKEEERANIIKEELNNKWKKDFYEHKKNVIVICFYM